MKKKLISMLLAAAMVLSTTVIPVSATNQRFSDVPDTHWAYSYIQSAAADGVMNGTGEGLFSPSKTLSRAEFIVMMMRAFYADDVAAKEAELKNKGIEVTWYTAHCALACDNDLLANADGCSAIEDSILKLYRPDSVLYELAEDLSFSSSAFISRIDMAVIASNIMLEKGVQALSDADFSSTSASIPDINEVSYSRQRAMATAYYYKVITGIDANGTFNPSGTVDRASVAAIYCRLRDCIKTQGSQTTPPSPTPTPSSTPSVEPSPAPTAPPVASGAKAPYATTEESIVGTVSDSEVTLSLNTHKAPVDYWSKHPELASFVNKDEYNAYVFMALNRQWLVENKVSDSKRFNYPCFTQDGATTLTGRIPFTDYGVGNTSYREDFANYDAKNINIFAVSRVKPLEQQENGAFVPIFTKFTPNMSDKDKIVIMVEALCEKLTYNDGSLEVADIPGAMSSNYWKSSAPLLKGICDDYAYMFSQICSAAGIPSMICTGKNHAWNLVYADQEWYIVDATAVDTGGYKPLATEAEYFSINGWEFDHSYDNSKFIIEALYKDVFGK